MYLILIYLIPPNALDLRPKDRVGSRSCNLVFPRQVYSVVYDIGIVPG